MVLENTVPFFYHNVAIGTVANPNITWEKQ